MVNSLISKKSLPATLYVLLFSLYTVAFSLHQNVQLIRFLYIPFYALSFWYMLKTLKYYFNASYIKILTILFLLILVYGTLLIVSGTDASWKRQTDPTNNLFLYVSSIIPLYAFYYFGRKKMLSTYWFQLMLVVFFADAYALYYEKETTIMNMMSIEEGSFTNNTGYFFISLLPMIVFFDKKKIIQYGTLIVISIFTILCFKRGAILVGIFAIFYFMVNEFKAKSGLKKILVVAISAIVVSVLYQFVENLLLENDYFYYRLQSTAEGNSSGRDSLYSWFWNYYISEENGLLGLLLGNGAGATIRIHGYEAHNDWLEIAINMGLLGIVVYIMYWATMFKYYRFAKKHLQNEIAIAMGMVLIINFSRTFFSMSLNGMSFFSASLIGYTMSMVDCQLNMCTKNLVKNKKR